jgi:hypothetical protein
MLIACLWSRWTAKDQPDLLSFAAITDDPPPEVVAAGHDRCIVPINPENVEAWLNPDPSDLGMIAIARTTNTDLPHDIWRPILTVYARGAFRVIGADGTPTVPWSIESENGRIIENCEKKCA